MTTVGFVGLGNMGGPMSRRLLAAGIDVLGFDLADAARTAFAADGGTVVDSTAEAAAADVVFLMLPDSRVVDAVVTAQPFLAALRPGAVVVDMSSSEPARTRALAATVARDGVGFVDAPVSGGVGRAVTGQLAVMVGGADADVERVAPLLAHFGTVHRAGPVGAGHAVKALNNLMSATHLLITSEAMLVGERFGLDPATILAIVNGSSGRSGSTENKWPNFILPETYDSGFALRLMLKDMRIATALADGVEVLSALGEQAVAVWSRAASELPDDADHTEIARWLRTSAGQVAAR